MHENRPPSDLLLRDFERWVVHELRAMREENRNWMTRLHLIVNEMEHTMVSSSRTLMAAIVNADSKLDGYAAIITANTQAIRDAQAALLALKDEPTTDEVQKVITDLGTHLSNVDTAVANLSSSPVPAAPADGTVPQPAPAAPVA